MTMTGKRRLKIYIPDGTTIEWSEEKDHVRIYDDRDNAYLTVRIVKEDGVLLIYKGFPFILETNERPRVADEQNIQKPRLNYDTR